MKNRYLLMALFLFFGTWIGCASTGNYKEKELTPEEEQALESYLSGQASEFNIPIVINKQVENFIHYFQTAHRPHFVRWLARSQRYIPVMQGILKENNLPTDLVYMAMIESGFNTRAYSRAKAAGPWQFIQGTGKRYGLNINWWMDERRDPIKSTKAASQYLKELYDMFDSWLLAAAGYNAGENKIKHAILRHNTEDFWQMARFRYLKPETRQYIPKLIAAALIAKNPEKYGFSDVEYEEPFEFDTVTVTEPTDLRTVAEIIDAPYEEVHALNPELLRWCTPPDVTEYMLRIPTGKKEIFEEKYAELKPKGKMLFHTHKIRPGDTLYKIAHFYKIGIQPILEMNHLKSGTYLRPGQQLIIPVKAHEVSEEG